MENDRNIGLDDRRSAAPSAAAEKKQPRKKRLFFCWIAVAAAILVTGCVFALPPVRNRLLFDKTYLRIDYDSFDAIIRAGAFSPSEEFHELDRSRLSALDPGDYHKAAFYLCWEKHPAPFSLPRYCLVADVKKGTVRTEIVYYLRTERHGVPDRFTMTRRTDSFQIDDMLITYTIVKNRIECAFFDETGTYLIFCHSTDTNDLLAVLEDILDRTIETQ